VRAGQSAALYPPMRGRMVMTAGHPLEVGGGGPADRCHTYLEVLIRVRLLKLRRRFAT
jgi:hypothetical protein